MWYPPRLCLLLLWGLAVAPSPQSPTHEPQAPALLWLPTTPEMAPTEASLPVCPLQCPAVGPLHLYRASGRRLCYHVSPCSSHLQRPAERSARPQSVWVLAWLLSLSLALQGEAQSPRAAGTLGGLEGSQLPSRALRPDQGAHSFRITQQSVLLGGWVGGGGL